MYFNCAVHVLRRVNKKVFRQRHDRSKLGCRRFRKIRKVECCVSFSTKRVLSYITFLKYAS
jgi:hypothetical protein